MLLPDVILPNEHDRYEVLVKHYNEQFCNNLYFLKVLLIMILLWLK